MGNTCRSPMAEAYLNAKADEHNMDIEAQSAGLAAIAGDEISYFAKEALRNKGIGEKYYINHRARPVSKYLIEQSDVILCLDKSYMMPLLSAFPEFSSKIESFSESVGDPFGADLAVYEETLEKIAENIDLRFMTGSA